MDHYGILAYPAAHSRSPQMHTVAFETLEIDAVFERYEIPPDELNTFFDQNFRKNRRIQGLAVSIPHKESIIPLLDTIDAAAKKIGAVNTVYWQEEKLCGTNTDFLGFSRALGESYAGEGKKVLVLGAGGAARAIIYALLQDGADQVIIANRTEDKAAQLAQEFHVQWKPLNELFASEYDLVVNTTALGMKGESENISPLPADFWRAHLTAFDIVYTPLQTRFLKDAATAGAQALSGEKMFLYQGMAQFELWTGREAPLESMRNSIE